MATIKADKENAEQPEEPDFGVLRLPSPEFKHRPSVHSKIHTEVGYFSASSFSIWRDDDTDGKFQFTIPPAGNWCLSSFEIQEMIQWLQIELNADSLHDHDNDTP
jgi:hypothetical protein